MERNLLFVTIVRNTNWKSFFVLVLKIAAEAVQKERKTRWMAFLAGNVIPLFK